MTFKQFAYQWIRHNVTGDYQTAFLTDIIDLIAHWRLSGRELSIYMSSLVLLITDWNKTQDYD